MSKLCGLAVALLIGTMTGHAQVEVGSVLPYVAETPHPYSRGDEQRPIVWQERVISPGAKMLRVHFTGMSLAPHDYLTISLPDGSQVWSYVGRGPYGDGEFWSYTVEGNEAVVTLHGGPLPGYGYRIDAIAHGDFPFPGLQSGDPAAANNCGYENVACHKDDKNFWNGQKPVAQLYYMKNNKWYYATGWLVMAKNKDTLITNNHAISTQDVVKTLKAKFNYQTANCDGGEIGPVDIYDGDTLLETNQDLDYTLLSLKGKPQEKYGVLQATTKKITKKTNQVWLPQHPDPGKEAERVKLAGWFADDDKKTRCRIKRNVGANGVDYDCGTKAASSGSPVENADVPKGASGPLVVALHNSGVGGDAKCVGNGNWMAAICADDAKNKALLVCSND